jgi:hypothetical protein
MDVEITIIHPDLISTPSVKSSHWPSAAVQSMIHRFKLGLFLVVSCFGSVVRRALALGALILAKVQRTNSKH